MGEPGCENAFKHYFGTFALASHLSRFGNQAQELSCAVTGVLAHTGILNGRML